MAIADIWLQPKWKLTWFQRAGGPVLKGSYASRFEGLRVRLKQIVLLWTLFFIHEELLVTKLKEGVPLAKCQEIRVAGTDWPDLKVVLNVSPFGWNVFCHYVVLKLYDVRTSINIQALLKHTAFKANAIRIYIPKRDFTSNSIVICEATLLRAK